MQYLKPKTLEEAVKLLEEYKDKAKIYAGGTDLLVDLRDKGGHIEGVEAYVDINSIPELLEIKVDKDSLFIGAGVTHTKIGDSSIIKEYLPSLCTASNSVGSKQIRNSGTIGGNVCNGSLAADTISVLVSSDAKVIIKSKDSERSVDIADLYLGGKKQDRKPNEIVVGFSIPILKNYKFSYIKLGRRKALAISRMNVSVAIKLDGDVIEDARIAPGCVFTKPERAFSAEDLLKGKKVSDKLFEDAGKAVADRMIELTGVRWSTEYKKPVISALTDRALQEAIK